MMMNRSNAMAATLALGQTCVARKLKGESKAEEDDDESDVVVVDDDDGTAVNCIGSDTAKQNGEGSKTTVSLSCAFC